MERKYEKHAIKERVDELLALIKLENAAERYPSEISGGQAQRVAVARAVAHPPSVLLMDEPLGALDLKLRETMQIELRRIQQELGITAVMYARPIRSNEYVRQNCCYEFGCY